MLYHGWSYRLRHQEGDYRMSGMVEKVARAICALHYHDPGELTNAYPDGPMYPVWKDFESSARAAIEAMAAPTSGMCKAACAAMSPGKRPTPNRVSHKAKHAIRYRAMIQAALKEQE